MSFGKYAITAPITHNFKLEPDWWWKIKPPTSGDELEMTKFYSHNRVLTGPDGVRREYFPTNVEIAHREIALTFGGTNIPKDEKDGDPILAPDAKIEAVEAVLRKMPQEMVMEIWEAIGEHVPGWGPMRPKGRSSSED